MDRLKGKVAVVTGGALGIGRACCERMAAEGAKVAVFDLNDAEGRGLAARLKEANYWHVDVSNEAQVKAAIDEAAKRFGRLDVLVNNAGIGGADKPTHELTEEEWDQVQAVNVKGVFFCTKHAIPHLRRAGAGSIVNLSSVYGMIGAGDVPPYHASKGAVRLMSRNDAITYAPDGIRVNSLHPGFIWTPMVQAHAKSTGDEKAARDALVALHPLGRLGEADDIAWGVVYLASDESKFVTGSEMVIDGGYTAR